MTLHVPIWMQAGGGDPDIDYSAANDRALLSGIWRSEGVVRHGTSGAGSLKVSQRAAGANFSVDVAPGFGVVEGDDVSGQGLYMVWSDAIVNVTVPSPPVSGSRTHRIVAQVRDKLHEGTWSTYDWTPLLVEDTSGSTPAVPDSAIPLARVTVAAGQVSVLDANITDDRINAMTLLGRPAFGSADSDRPANPVDGELFRRVDKGCLEIAIGGTWYEIYLSGGGPAWATYTPTLTATSSNPTMGTSAVREGSYVRVGRMVTVCVNIKFGTSGAAAGSGTYEVSLPVTAKTRASGRQQGSLTVLDVSANDFMDGSVFIDKSATTKVRLSLDSAVVTNSGPWTWANNDEISFTITYEAA